MSSLSVPTPAAAEPTPVVPAPAVPAVAAAAPAERAKTRRSVHIPALDGVRGLAILLVLVFHFSQSGYSNQATGVRLAVQKLTGAGWVGVDLFFVLSGFLITSILCEAVGTRGYFKNFYMRRALRIFPLYFGALIVAFGVIPLLFGWQPRYAEVYRNQWALWLYVQNFVPIDWRAFSHFWSLAVEEHFYLVWPAVVFFLGRRGSIAACLLMIVTALAVRIYRARYFPDLAHETYIWTICRMDSLAIGSLLALAVGGVATDLRRFARFAPWVLVAAAIGCGVLFRKHGSFSYVHQGIQAVGYTTVALGSAALLVMAVNAAPGGLLGRVFNAGGLRFLGKYSYGIYVFHNVIQHYMFDHVPIKGLQPLVGGSFWAAYGLYALIATGVSIGLALLSWHVYEKHFLKLKRFFEYRAPTLEGFRPNEPVSAGRP